LNCLDHTLLQLLFFLLINNTHCFSWLFIFEHLFLSYFTSYGNINIHHIHIRNDILCLNNRLNFYYCHEFPLEHFLHLNKLWTIYHFTAIQATNVTCIWRCLLCFLTWLCYFCGRHRGLFFLLPACFHIVIYHHTIYAMFVSLPCIILCFCWYCLLILCGINNALLAFAIVIPSSHNIVASLCYCNVDRFILVIVIPRYDCKHVLNTIVKRLFVVDICKPWANF
jgi:hypothetical protein